MDSYYFIAVFFVLACKSILPKWNQAWRQWRAGSWLGRGKEFFWQEAKRKRKYQFCKKSWNIEESRRQDWEWHSIGKKNPHGVCLAETDLIGSSGRYFPAGGMKVPGIIVTASVAGKPCNACELNAREVSDWTWTWLRVDRWEDFNIFKWKWVVSRFRRQFRISTGFEDHSWRPGSHLSKQRFEHVDVEDKLKPLVSVSRIAKLKAGDAMW